MPSRRFLPLVATLVCVACAGPAGDGLHADGEAAPAPKTLQAATTDGTYSVRVDFAAATPPFNEPFELVVTLRESDASAAAVADADVIVSAWMPAHGHGMNRYPSVEPLGDGRYRVRGMLLHMLGHWELYVDVIRDRLASRAVFELDLS